MNFFKSKAVSSLYDRLERVMGQFPGTNEKITINTFLAGIITTGSSRSGKTSAVLKFLVTLWFKYGLGGLFATARVGDAKMIKRWALEAGRKEEDIIIFDKDSAYMLSLFDFEKTRTDEGAYDTSEIANNMLLVHEVISSFTAGGSSSKNEEPFWKNSSSNLIINCIDLLKYSGTPISWKNIRLMAQDGFDESELNQYIELQEIIENDDNSDERKQEALETIEKWKQNNFFLRCFEIANKRSDLSEEELERFTDLGDYWYRQYPKLAEKTKSIILEILYSICRPFEASKILKNHFSRNVSEKIHPDRTILDNKIIILDFPVKKYGVNGVIATAITKLIFQQAWERRDLEKEGSEANPVMLMIDEFQYYINNANNTDTLFTSTAGGSLVAQCYVTQNIENVIMAMGGRPMESHAKSLLGNLNLKIFCANSDYATNKWASDMIGSHFVDTESTTIDPDGVKKTFNQSWQPKVPVSHFTTLRTGKKENNYNVDTIVLQTGRKWVNGENFSEITFTQK